MSTKTYTRIETEAYLTPYGIENGYSLRGDRLVVPEEDRRGAPSVFPAILDPASINKRDRGPAVAAQSRAIAYRRVSIVETFDTVTQLTHVARERLPDQPASGAYSTTARNPNPILASPRGSGKTIHRKTLVDK